MSQPTCHKHLAKHCQMLRKTKQSRFTTVFRPIANIRLANGCCIYLLVRKDESLGQCHGFTTDRRMDNHHWTILNANIESENRFFNFSLCLLMFFIFFRGFSIFYPKCSISCGVGLWLNGVFRCSSEWIWSLRTTIGGFQTMLTGIMNLTLCVRAPQGKNEWTTATKWPVENED